MDRIPIKDYHRGFILLLSKFISPYLPSWEFILKVDWIFNRSESNVKQTQKVRSEFLWWHEVSLAPVRLLCGLRQRLACNRAPRWGEVSLCKPGGGAPGSQKSVCKVIKSGISPVLQPGQAAPGPHQLSLKVQSQRIREFRKEVLWQLLFI